MTETMTRKEVVRSYVLSPAEAFAARREADEFERTAPKLYWCNETLGKNLSPMMLGDFVGVLAYTSNGKTSLALAQAYFEARKLMRDKKDTTHSVAYYTWDQPAETLESKIEKMLLRDLNITPDRYTLAHRMQLPLWWGGKNKRNQRRSKYRIPQLTLEMIDEVLNEIVGAEKTPALVVIDYVQRVPLEISSDRSDTVLRAAERLADFAARRDVTMIMTIQAARTVLSRNDKTPLIHEAQWSSGIEQSCDKMFSLWRPATSEAPGTPIDCGEQGKRATDSELIKGKVLKDRGSETNIDFAFPFNMAEMKIGDY
jgi:hypothetical protein